MPLTKLASLRQEIDSIDVEILQLLLARAGLAMQVFEQKKREGNEHNSYVPEREAQVLDKVAKLLQEQSQHKLATNTGQSPLPTLKSEQLAAIFGEIMGACRHLEQKLKVVYLGPRGTFTEAAARKHFSQSCSLEEVVSIPQIFQEVRVGNANYGVLPVENSNEGMVGLSLRMLEEYKIPIVGEIFLAIEQNLLGPHGMDLRSIEVIYAHQQSLAQCQRWISEHLPTANKVETRSNAEAAQRVAESASANCAAIGAASCADIYKLELMRTRIEDNPDNITRFLVIGDYRCNPSGNDKSSLVAEVKNKPGALYKLLKCFYDEGLDMTRLESQPGPSAQGSYKFFIDCRGHQDQDEVRRCLQAMEEHSSKIKFLGSYPAARR